MKQIQVFRGFFAIFFLACGIMQTTAAGETQTLSIGGLLPLTGSLQSNGLSSQAAIELGIEDINAYLQRQDSSYRIKADILDAASNPDTAYAAAQNLIQSGHRFIIGPFDSSSVEAVKPLVDQSASIVVSPGSSSTRLSIPGDRIFRMSPDDSRQGDAISFYLSKKGITRIIPVYINESFGVSLYTQTKKYVEERGGSYTDAIQIAHDQTNFTDTVAQLNQAVSKALGEVQAVSVAVHIIAYQQIVSIFEQAAAYPALSQVTWIGNDGFTGNSSVLNQTKAADFAIQTKFVSPVFQLDFDPNPAVEALNYRMSQKLGYMADTLSLQTYDALWLGALALIHQQEAGITDIKDAFTGILPQYRGYTQVVRFNANGDRYTGMYVFKNIEKGEAIYRWQKNSAFVFITQDPSNITANTGTNPVEELPVKNRLLLTRRPVVPAQGAYILPALVPLTGPSSKTNESAQPAIKFAETDLNRYLGMNGSKSTIQVQLNDTQSDANTALNLLNTIASQKNSKIVIGPYTSEELKSAANFANTNNLILLSPGSTAVSLAIENDAIYRMVMDDSKQANALSQYLEKEGIKTLIPIWINDEYGNSLQSELKKVFAQGGKTILDGATYNSTQSDFSTVLKTVQDQVTDAKKTQSASTIGVVLIAFDEGISILSAAGNYAGLDSVRWFGSDSLAKTSAILTNVKARDFAERTGFTASYFAPELDLYVWSIAAGQLVKSYFENFLTRYQQEYNTNLGSYTYSSYDAVWLTAMTNFQLTAASDLKTIVTIMRSTFNLSPGYNERNQFNTAGDKAFGTFGFSKLSKAGTWDSIASYHFANDRPNWLEYYADNQASSAAGWELYP